MDYDDILSAYERVADPRAATRNRTLFEVGALRAALADQAGAPLLITTGPGNGEVMGPVGEERVIHASLSPQAYRRLFAQHGFEVLWFRPEDAEFHGHSVWLAQRSGGIA